MECVTHIFRLWTRYVQTRGLKWTVGRFKSLRLCVTRFLCGNPIKVTQGIGLRANGLPKCLGIVNSLFESKDPDNIRFGLTLLSIGKPIKLELEPDLDSIRDKWEGSHHEGLRNFLPTFVAGLKYSNPVWYDPHWSTKSGPNGHALGRSIDELVSIPYYLQVALKALGGKNFSDYIRALTKACSGKSVPENICFRKLSFLQDKEGKTRVIAIFDYWSQSVLKPYHDTIMKILRSLPGDFTYQGKPDKWLSHGEGSYYSMDLKSATDRFPLSVQKELFELLFGKKAAEAWAFVMSGLPFSYKDKGVEGTVIYGAGQPMGAYSSWAMFTLCHHAILQYVTSVYPNTRYAILGDDIVIRGDKGATLYKAIMDVLKVEISESKTHTSVNSFEFAKRWFISGVEVSPFPIWALIEAKTSPVKLVMVLIDAIQKGWSGLGYHRTQVITSMLIEVHGIWARHAHNTARRCYIFWDILHLVRSDDLPMMSATKVVEIAEKLNVLPEGVSACNHVKHVVASLQRAFNNASARVTSESLKSLDASVQALSGSSHPEDTPALAELHPAVKAAQAMLEATVDGGLFYRDLALFYELGMKASGIPLDEKFSSISKIIPVGKIPIPSEIFSERKAVQVINDQAKIITYVKTEWRACARHPELNGKDQAD